MLQNQIDIPVYKIIYNYIYDLGFIVFVTLIWYSVKN